MQRTFLVWLLAALSVASACEAQPPPAYRFTVGETLVYELRDTKNDRANSTDKDRHFESHARWRVVPVRQNTDGSWRLVVQTHTRLLRWDRATSEEDDPDSSTGEWLDEPRVRLDHTHLGWVDLQPDGSYEPNATTGYSYFFKLTPEVLLWPLPPADAGGPVTLVGTETGTRYTLKAEPNGDRLIGSLERGENIGRGTTHRIAIDFDPERGRPLRSVETIESASEPDGPPRQITIELAATESRDAEWAARFDAAAERHFAAIAQWNRDFQAAQATRTAAASEAALDVARAKLASAAEADADAPGPVREAYEGLLDEHDRIRDWEIDDARDRERVYALPAVDWRAETLDGEARSRSDYEGRVVVLDFWYRGCSHCVKALPKVAELAERYSDRPVTFLGVNRDRDLKDARVVLERAPTPFEHVRDWAQIENWGEVSDKPEPDEPPLSQAYRVTMWPTYVVLGPDGRVAEVRAGAGANVSARLSEAIDAALAGG